MSVIGPCLAERSQHS